MNELKLIRLDWRMEPEPGNPMEIEGILNPAAVRGPDGNLYLFPRMVSKGNYSRIGIARVLFNQAGDPSGVERLGIALEPETAFERRSDGTGGCEDPRISYVQPLAYYVMTYTALTQEGPRIALAISRDLFHWKRLGLATFQPFKDIQFDGIDNKDASVFPLAIPDPVGQPSLAILHRPLFPGTRPEQKVYDPTPEVKDIQRESIWISYRPLTISDTQTYSLRHFTLHHRLASPVAPWEKLKIGGGTPPIMTRFGWLIFYHGVSKMESLGENGHHFCYSAGLMILSREHPHEILFRSSKPVLTPELIQERHGVVENVVFPTAIDRRDDINNPHRLDVYYGMADRSIGVARLDLPDILPKPEIAADREQDEVVKASKKE